MEISIEQRHPDAVLLEMITDHPLSQNRLHKILICNGLYAVDLGLLFFENDIWYVK